VEEYLEVEDARFNRYRHKTGRIAIYVERDRDIGVNRYIWVIRWRRCMKFYGKCSVAYDKSNLLIY
jgi:hypothetical protein